MSIKNNTLILISCILIIFFVNLNITNIYAQTHFEWTQQLGDVYLDEATSIFTDAAGNSYLTGMLQGSTAFDGDTAISFNLFAAKYDANGNQQWLTEVGSTDIERGNSITVDPMGNSYITGYFNEQVPDYQGDTLSVWEDTDMMTAKLNPSGQVQWVRQVASNSETEGVAIVANDAGEVYVAGLFKDRVAFDIDEFSLSNDSLTFNGELYITPLIQQVFGDDTLTVVQDTLVFNSDTTVVASNNLVRIYSNRLETDSENTDIVLIKYDTNGNLLWNKRLGGFESEVLTDMTLDAAGNLLLTGYFWEMTEFDSQPLVSAGKNDIFLTKLNDNGDLIWAKSAGGTGDDLSHAIATNKADGSIYITGTYDFISDFEDITIYGAADDFFFANYNAEGTVLDVKNATGDGLQIGTDIAIDHNTNSIYLTGVYENSIDIQGLSVIGAIGRKSIFILHFSNNNLKLLSSIDGASDQTTIANPHIGADAEGNAYLSTFFTKKLQLAGLESRGSSDILIGRINNNIISSIKDQETFLLQKDLLKIYLFPNPTQSIISIDFNQINNIYPIATFQISDILGQVLYQDKQEVTNKIHQIAINHLPQGIYWLQIKLGEQVQTIEFIKNK